MNRKLKIIILVPVVLALLYVGWAAQTAPDRTPRQRWLRVIETEMVLAPRLTRTFQPNPYQSVEVVIGAGEFAPRTTGSFARKAAPSGNLATVRLDTSDDEFLVLALGGTDNLGKWRNQVVHYIPWDKIVDIYFETSPVAGGVVR
ncbi:MAG: hypothetical protein EHM61_07765 [Acidobacteria bacterium]|nr:MAG: hypothetical protein EHM61_07765 [Acidobacteriota bacterium]